MLRSLRKFNWINSIKPLNVCNLTKQDFKNIITHLHFINTLSIKCSLTFFRETSKQLPVWQISKHAKSHLLWRAFHGIAAESPQPEMHPFHVVTHNCEVKCNLDMGNYSDLQSGKSGAVQVTPFCGVSISSHNGGLYEDRSLCQASIKGLKKQSRFRESINQCLFSSVHLDVTLKSWLTGSLVEVGFSDVQVGDLFFF